MVVAVIKKVVTEIKKEDPGFHDFKQCKYFRGYSMEGGFSHERIS